MTTLDLSARLHAITRRSRQHALERGHVLADPRQPTVEASGSYPILVDRAEGARVVDVDGNEYVDLSMARGAALLGHGAARPLLEEQITDGLGLGPNSRLAHEVAARLARISGAERIAFLTTGTEAIMTSLRLARSAHRRSRVAVFEASRHGHFDGVLGGRVMEQGNAPGVSRYALDGALVVSPTKTGLSRLEQESATLAAILVDPLSLSLRGEDEASVLVQELRAIADRREMALVFDERQTGLRYAGGAAGHWKVASDLSIYGKALAGGLPIGVVAGLRRYLDHVDGGAWSFGDDSFPSVQKTFLAGTFNKHPFSMAAALHTLEALEEQPELTGQLRSLAERVSRVFVAALGRAASRLDVRQTSSIVVLRGEPSILEVARAALLTAGLHVEHDPGRPLFFCIAAPHRELEDELARRLDAAARDIDAELARVDRKAVVRRLPGAATDGRPLRLFSLHGAGQQASMFRAWGPLLGPSVDAWVLELPGRGLLADVPRITSFEDALGLLLEQVRPHAQQAYALCGFSMGALLAFELARRLHDLGRGPELLVVAGEMPPHRPPRQPIGDPLTVPEADLVDFVQNHARLAGAASAEDHGAALRRIVPLLRSDLSICATYRFAASSLRCPVLAFGGADDALAPPDEIEHWRDLTSGRFRHHVLVGDHGFIASAYQELIAELTSVVSDVVHGLAPMPLTPVVRGC